MDSQGGRLYFKIYKKYKYYYKYKQKVSNRLIFM